MEILIQFIKDALFYLKDLNALIQLAGYTGLILIVFAETGLLVGFFLPGDSLLITAGLFAARGDLNVWALCIMLTIAAIVGDAVGYYIGRKAGPLLYERPNSFFFRKSHLLKAKAFYDENGGKTIIISRFIPIVRTFAPTIAGVAGMPYKKFLSYNIFGGFLWIWSLLWAGYLLGSVVPNIDKYIHYIIAGVIVASIIPILLKWLQARRKVIENEISEV